jgi:hypothetical protein
MDDPKDVNTTESSPVETDNTPQAEAESAPVETVETEIPKEEVKTEEAPKKGAQSRIQELVADKKAAEEKAQSLEEKLAALTGSVEPTPQATYTPPIKPDEEFTPQFKEEVLKTADALVNLKIKQSEAVQRINSEAGQVVRKYPQLDPESESFDKELSDRVSKQVLKLVRAEPFTASPKEIVDDLMHIHKMEVTKEVGKATENLAKQVSETAVRPTSVQHTEKPFNELSIKEMEKKLGVVNP